MMPYQPYRDSSSSPRREMRRQVGTLTLVFGYLALAVVVRGLDQSGFISIDCGINPGFSYFDSTTKIYYSSDSEFINTGINYNVSDEYSSKFEIHDQQLMNVRSFPEGVKNCYTLQPQQGKENNYLIRASFMYGNYDSKNQLPLFKLYLGVDEWDTVNIQNANDIIRKEIIHVTKTDDIYVCLVNTGSGTPFISALELRQLNDSIYTTQSGSLILFRRLDLGSRTSQTVRYKDDVFDRIWTPFNWPHWKSVNLSSSSSTLSDNSFKPPDVIMATAVTPADEKYPLEFHWNLDNSTRQFCVYMHFAEVEELQSNQLREFYVSLNGWFWGPEPIVPGRLLPHTGFNTRSISASSELSFSIYKTSRSTLPPILNALEIYEIKHLFQSSTIQSNVDALKKIEATYMVKKNWQGDPCLPMEYSWDGVSCAYSSPSSPCIISLNLSWSKLAGMIDSSFSNLTSLKYLDLSYNSLTGEVPDFLSKLPSLKTLNLSGNNLTGSVPLTLIDKSRNGSLSLRLDGNPNLCKTISCEEEKEKEREKEKKNNVIDPVVTSITSVLVLLLIELAALWIFKWRRQYAHPNEDDKSFESKNPRLSYSDVQRITHNFQKLLGQGSSTKVYHGHLRDGTEVAVKVLSSSSMLGFKQFKTEAHLLTRVHHKHLVSLIGYCDEGSNMVLIYEYMPKGNLKDYLSGKKEIVLTWEQRLRIAIDAAQALEYLHNGCNPTIIHRNVKIDNILLNENLQAKVADFGWSRSMLSEGRSYLSTASVATPGYLDPEYHRTSVLNEKTDVYSFGIVLLEIISGQSLTKRITKESPFDIANWVRTIIAKGDKRMIVDPMLQGHFETSSVWRAMETAISCVVLSSTDRPNMSDVVADLKGCLKMAIFSEKANAVEEEFDCVCTEGAHERIDDMEKEHDHVSTKDAHGRNSNLAEDHGPVGTEADHDRNDNMEEDHGRLGIESAYERADNLEEGHASVGIEAAHGRNGNTEEDHGPVGIVGAHERTDNLDEDHGPISSEGAHERTDNAEEGHDPMGIEGAHGRTDNGAKDHGSVGIEAACERNDNVEDDQSPVGPAMAMQESLEGDLDFYEANSHEKDNEKAREREKNVVPTLASISLGQLPSCAFTTSGRFEKRQQHDIIVKPNEDDETFGPKNRDLRYSEVQRITDNFQNVLGQGASAKVYHGHLSDGTEVAVKVLSPSSTLGLKQFKTEAQLLTRVHHKNLVSLIGYCNEDSNMVLVYEFMAKGNLKEYLSGKRKAVLSWEQRLQIAIDAAQALEYLHNGCNPPIIHRDVKTENILLNEKLQAKVADFGWSRSMPPEGGSYISTAIVGTLGYLDPEYHRTSVPNEKTDVYSFGIVLLELISGRPAIIKITGESPCNIADWVRPIIAKGDISMIVDPRLEGEFEINSARRAVETAMLCVPFSSSDRPTMSGVVAELKECLNIKIAHERRDIVEEDIGPVDIETEVALRESLDDELYDFKTSSYEDVKGKQKKKNKKKNAIVPAANSITSVLVGTWKRIWQHAPDKISSEFGRIIGEGTSRKFSYSEILIITDNFLKVLGRGGTGTVYHGLLSDGTEVAVKTLSHLFADSFDRCHNQALLLTRVHHRNLVSLLGYCEEHSSMMLIYEYMAEGDLKQNLSGENVGVLSWEQRVGIAIDAAQGLEYLHEGCQPPIILRDIKSSKILLNENLRAKVAGIGWSGLIMHDESATHLTTMVVGTPGYLDPEYYATSWLSKKSDVYSFGVVLLELISGQPAIIRSDDGPVHLIVWVGSLLKSGRIGDIVDPRLNGELDMNAAWNFVETAMGCVSERSGNRPTMTEVVSLLRRYVNIETPTGLDLSSGDV